VRRGPARERGDGRWFPLDQGNLKSRRGDETKPEIPTRRTLRRPSSAPNASTTQPQLVLELRAEGGRRVARLEAVEERWEGMVLGTPWVASCTVTVTEEKIESCSGLEAAEHLT
jgi:hypothetical protein